MADGTIPDVFSETTQAAVEIARLLANSGLEIDQQQAVLRIAGELVDTQQVHRSSDFIRRVVPRGATSVSQDTLDAIANTPVTWSGNRKL